MPPPPLSTTTRARCPGSGPVPRSDPERRGGTPGRPGATTGGPPPAAGRPGRWTPPVDAVGPPVGQDGRPVGDRGRTTRGPGPAWTRPPPSGLRPGGRTTRAAAGRPPARLSGFRAPGVVVEHPTDGRLGRRLGPGPAGPPARPSAAGPPDGSRPADARPPEPGPRGRSTPVGIGPGPDGVDRHRLGPGRGRLGHQGRPGTWRSGTDRGAGRPQAAGRDAPQDPAGSTPPPRPPRAGPPGAGRPGIGQKRPVQLVGQGEDVGRRSGPGAGHHQPGPAGPVGQGPGGIGGGGRRDPVPRAPLGSTGRQRARPADQGLSERQVEVDRSGRPGLRGRSRPGPGRRPTARLRPGRARPPRGQAPSGRPVRTGRPGRWSGGRPRPGARAAGRPCRRSAARRRGGPRPPPGAARPPPCRWSVRTTRRPARGQGQAEGEEAGAAARPAGRGGAARPRSARARAIGVDRGPGATTTSVTSPRIHSSTSVAANVAWASGEGLEVLRPRSAVRSPVVVAPAHVEVEAPARRWCWSTASPRPAGCGGPVAGSPGQRPPRSSRWTRPATAAPRPPGGLGCPGGGGGARRPGRGALRPLGYSLGARVVPPRGPAGPGRVRRLVLIGGTAGIDGRRRPGGPAGPATRPWPTSSKPRGRGRVRARWLASPCSPACDDGRRGRRRACENTAPAWRPVCGWPAPGPRTRCGTGWPELAMPVLVVAGESDDAFRARGGPGGRASVRTPAGPWCPGPGTPPTCEPPTPSWPPGRPLPGSTPARPAGHGRRGRYRAQSHGRRGRRRRPAGAGRSAPSTVTESRPVGAPEHGRHRGHGQRGGQQGEQGPGADQATRATPTATDHQARRRASRRGTVAEPDGQGPLARASSPAPVAEVVGHQQGGGQEADGDGGRTGGQAERWACST